MEFSKLFSFCTIVDCGSMSKASELLYCSQPALSKQIASLEKELGYPLFQRNGRKITVSENGKLLYQFGKQVEREYNQLKAELYKQNHAYSSEIHLGATNFIGTYLLPPILSNFKKTYPNISVNFSVNFFPNIMDLLYQEAIDFAIIPEDYQTVHNPAYVCQPFRNDEMLVVFPVSHPFAEKEFIEPDDLKWYPFLVSQIQSASRTFILSRLNAQGIHLTNLQNMYNTSTIKQSVINGLGISILSKNQILNDEKNGLLKSAPLKGVDLVRKLYVVHKKSYILTEEARLFMQFILPPTQS